MAEFDAAAQALTNPPDLQALGHILGQLVQARLEPLPERQVLTAIKSATGIAVSILEKQIGELRRRLNATGDVSRPAIRPRWANRLRIDVNGTPERNEANVITALSCDEAFAGTLVFDEFRQEIVVNRPLPWDEGDADIAAAVDRRRRRALRRVAAAARDQRRPGGGEPQRRRRRPRHPRPSGARVSEPPALGRHAAAGSVDRHPPRRRGHAAQPRLRLARG